MSNKNQSSIEWLYEQLTLTWYDYNSGKDLLEKAKTMHQEELIDFADNYVDNCVIPNEGMAIPTYMDVPEYYNETFKSNEA